VGGLHEKRRYRHEQHNDALIS